MTHTIFPTSPQVTRSAPFDSAPLLARLQNTKYPAEWTTTYDFTNPTAPSNHDSSTQEDNHTQKRQYLTPYSQRNEEEDTEEHRILKGAAKHAAETLPKDEERNMALESVNIWMSIVDDDEIGTKVSANNQDGQASVSKERGTTTGLHHDFHHNVYMLIRGKKRFVVFPPTDIRHLKPRGEVQTIYPNGLISYTSRPLRADGLSAEQAIREKIAMLELRIEQSNAEANEEVQEELNELYDDLLDKELQNADAQDDYDDMEASDCSWEDMGEEEVEDAEDSEEESVEEILDQSVKALPKNESDLPDSFCMISSAQLHSYLGIADDEEREEVTMENREALGKCSPQVIYMEAGDTLKLPVGWLHEVTSYGPSLAVNYWYYPPDQEDGTYGDKALWSHLILKSQQEFQRDTSSVVANDSQTKLNEIPHTT